MKSNIKKIVLILAATPILFLYTNFYQFSDSNPQSIRSYVFGPSPLSKDARDIFNLNANNQLAHNAFWTELRTRMDTIFIHAMYLDHLGLYIIANDDAQKRARAALIALNENQVQGLIKVQRDHNFKIIVDVGLSLGQNCTTQPAHVLAESAALREMELLNRFYMTTNAAGESVRRAHTLRIDAINVDGPFLRVIRGSRKAYSCDYRFSSSTNSWVVTNEGYDQTKSVEIVARYLSRLRYKIHVQQNTYPLVNLVLNLPNWNVGTQPGNFNLELLPLISEFSRSLYYPPINEISLDYPYGYIAVHGASRFSSKIQQLHSAMPQLHGRPKLSVIANHQVSFDDAKRIALADRTTSSGDTEIENGYECLVRGRQVPFILVYRNLCLNSPWRSYNEHREFAEDMIEYGDIEYVSKTMDYYRTLKNFMPAGVRVDTIYFESWYEFPSDSKVFGVKMVNMLNCLDPVYLPGSTTPRYACRTPEDLEN